MRGDIETVSAGAAAQLSRESLWAGTAYFVSTSLIVWLSVFFAQQFVVLSHEHRSAYSGLFFDRFLVWDGEWYMQIANDGYSFDPHKMSNAAFFPAFPALARCVSRVLQLDLVHAFVLTSHACLLAAFIYLHKYAKYRWNDQPAFVADYVLLAFGLFPTTFYFRMGYTESLFVLLCVLTLYGMRQRWPLWSIALIAGLATGTRTLGVALLAPLAIHLLETTSSWTAAIRRGIAVAPLAVWGLLGFIAYQWITLNEPFAFVRAQQNWAYNLDRPTDPLAKVIGLITLTPLRINYDPSCFCYWEGTSPAGNPLFNMRFAHAIYFSATMLIVLFGALRKWLDLKEVSVSLLLMGIPYVIHADAVCMDSESRYAAAVFPIYLVLGRALASAPATLSVAIGALSALLLACYTALFTSWYHYT